MKKRSYTYTGSVLAYMSGIDLSKNKLNRSIPSELRNLTRLRALNLSPNDLIGQIPISFSNLVQVESLDLSFNMLSGQIPPQLNQLNSLAVFSVAYNNLSGDTPEQKGQIYYLTYICLRSMRQIINREPGPQARRSSDKEKRRQTKNLDQASESGKATSEKVSLSVPKNTYRNITFDESSYEGNSLLSGPPLLKSCHPDAPSPTISQMMKTMTTPLTYLFFV
ncbi:putative leucine-rich repeat receptor-like serine/threonine-protein kinase At2g24130 [Vigna radiata var. radiata]|uniref:Leucine-rich repeat receptor-like serine/threonine-protein kinase At2g24130 n=1 Tax=Vigna radiata var. radiata TaxID=3916 RepID=A0A3Q0EU42_VIGRR|nr:putative leucine-rich repeat receptor-like serine/threonine-protein kinase At2g24130 [Vigna radiata var. radiata]